MLTVAERLLLKKCMVLRRIQSDRGIPLDLLLRGLDDDQVLTSAQRPDYCITTQGDTMGVIRDCLDDGTIKAHPGHGGTSYIRTPLGETFIRTLEPRLSNALDDLPMSGKSLLDFLARS